MTNNRKMPGYTLQKTGKRIRKWLVLYLMMIPGLAYLIVNNYLPLTGIVVAFKKYNVEDGIYGSPSVGLNNFQFLFKTKDSWIAIRNTLLYNAAFIVLKLVVAVTLSILICEMRSKRSKSVFQSVLLLPYLLSYTVVSYIVYAFLGTDRGFINNSIFSALNLPVINWYNSPQYWPVILTVVELWKGIGYSGLIYIANINGIDRQLYEAAELDGASKWQQIKTITLPSIMPSIITLTLLNIGRMFYSDFGLFYQVPMNSGLLTSTTQTMDTYVYRMLMNVGNIGMSSAASFLQSIVGFVLVLVANMIVRKIDKDMAMF